MRHAGVNWRPCTRYSLVDDVAGNGSWGSFGGSVLHGRHFLHAGLTSVAGPLAEIHMAVDRYEAHSTALRAAAAATCCYHPRPSRPSKDQSMPAAARETDTHDCKIKSHGGATITGVTQTTVTICYQPAAREGDPIACLESPSGNVIKVKTGAQTVLIEGKPAARKGDKTLHGGKITSGAPTVRIGNSPQAVALMKAGAPLVEPCEDGPPGPSEPMV